MDSTTSHGSDESARPDLAELTDRIERIERRIQHIERHLHLMPPRESSMPKALVAEPVGWMSGASSPVAPVPVEPMASVEPMALVEPTVPMEPGTPLDERGAPLPPTEPSLAAGLRERLGLQEQRDARTAAPTGAKPPPLPASPPKPAAPVRPLAYAARGSLVGKLPVPQGQLEQVIGLKLAGWIGAVVLVIGAAFGIKFAYDEGWLSGMPYGIRLTLMYLGGFGLIAAGEYVYRRVNQLSAAAVFGAGVAVLFLVSYAGHGYYELYSRNAAFLLMGLSTVIGAGVAMRGGMVSIAALSIIGGNIAPLVLRSDHPQLVPFLCYLLMLQAIAVFLSWWGRRGKWWTLRGLSLATVALWMIPVIDTSARSDTATLVTFALLYAAIYHAELILSATRRLKLEGRSPGLQGGVTFSTIVTALLCCGLLSILHHLPQTIQGIWVIGLAAVCAAMGFALTSLRGGALRPLSIAYRMQAAALVVVAVPVAFDGQWVLIGWSALALAFAGAGAALDLHVSRRAAAVTWVLAALYLVGWANGHSRFGARDTWLTLFDAAIPAYALMAGVLALVGHATAWLIQWRRDTEPPAQRLPVEREARFGEQFVLAAFVMIGAAFVWVGASLAALPTHGATVAILVFAWLLAGIDLLSPGRGVALQSAAVLALAAVKWVAVDALAERFSPGWKPMQYAPVINPVMGLGVAVAVSLVGIYFLRKRQFDAAMKRDPGSGALTFGFAAAIVAIMTLGLSLEIDRVVAQAAYSGKMLAFPEWHSRQLQWTLLWSASAAALFGLARWLVETERRGGLIAGLCVVPLLLGIKFLTIDTTLFRLSALPANVPALANLQGLVGVALVGVLALAGWLAYRADAARSANVRRLIGFVAVLLLLFAGSYEIDRAAVHNSGFARVGIVRQVGLSVFWSVFAVACVVAGFRFRTAALRYLGLALFAVTLLKVVLVDMSMGQVATGWRIISFMGLGLLLLGTSVLYGKLSPKLLGAKA